MGSGALLRSANKALGRSRSGAFLISFAPEPAPSFARVFGAWDFVNQTKNATPVDMCEDRNPPDPTPGPNRPDLGPWTAESRFQLSTQCLIRDFSPGYAMRLIINVGDPDEAELDFDLTANGFPDQAFSDYDPLFPWRRNRVTCRAILAASATLARSAASGGPFTDYDRNPPIGSDPGFRHLWQIEHWDGEILPTTFNRPMALDIPIQAPVAITAFAYEGTLPPLQVATSVGHGLSCGSAVRIFDDQDPPNEIIIRMGEVTADTFKWNLFFFDEWTFGATAFWRPAYDATVDQVSTC